MKKLSLFVFFTISAGEVVPDHITNLIQNSDENNEIVDHYFIRLNNLLQKIRLEIEYLSSCECTEDKDEDDEKEPFWIKYIQLTSDIKQPVKINGLYCIPKLNYSENDIPHFYIQEGDHNLWYVEAQLWGYDKFGYLFVIEEDGNRILKVAKT